VFIPLKALNFILKCFLIWWTLNISVMIFTCYSCSSITAPIMFMITLTKQHDTMMMMIRVRLHLWTAATSRPLVYLPGDIWAWRTMVEWCWQKKTPDSSTRALWQSYQDSCLVASRRNLVKGMMNMTLQSIFVHTSKWFFACLKILQHEVSGYTSPVKEGMLQIFISLKNPLPWLGLNPWTFGPVASTLNHYTTEATAHYHSFGPELGSSFVSCCIAFAYMNDWA
jgi:hypothetical protein